jgi:NAD(P)-dependent dehydrogenase (short-subunit alcohol dehydrogenase family)
VNELSQKVVVITGASGGLGRAVALKLASEGAHLVLAARREQALEETARLCRSEGGSAELQVTDVTREGDIARLAQLALERFGRIDVWLNNAGVTLFAKLEDGDFAQHRRVIETNLYGPIFAARVVVPIFRRQKQGVMINVGSILSRVGQAFVPSYVISKHGLRGLSQALRVELADEPDIHICSIYPYAMNTQHFEAGANLVGRRARALPPDQSIEKVAAAIVGLARRPRRELHVPRIAVLGLWLHRLMPRQTERLLLDALRAWHFDQGSETRPEGNLYRSDHPGAIAGERPPQLSTARFTLWALGRFAEIELQSVRRALSGRARSSS